jgi:hypothetical protein
MEASADLTEQSAGELQLLLPTDKRNPSFSLYLSDDERDIHVFYGLELFEVVPAQREHIAYKLLVARLYNAGIRVRTLEEVFEVDRKTMRGWGQALRSGKAEHLARVLLGTEVCRKRTAAIDEYVRRRWKALRKEGCRNYREMLQEEIGDIFDTRLSGETLRLLIAQIKAGENAATEEEPAPLEDVASHPMEESTCSSGDENDQEQPDPPVPEPSASGAELEGSGLPAAPGGSSKSIPPFGLPAQGATLLCDHAGLLLFAGALESLPRALEPAQPVLSQWLGSVLLGAANVEQTKYLNWQDLELLLGSVVRFPTPQREELQRLATPATVDAVLRWNFQQLGGAAAVGADLYFDPHTRHYTGMQAVLKGWCASIRWADKVLHSDFMHSTKGQPLYFECTDNFEDLRARFGPLVGRMRSTLCWPQGSVLTLVVDRGIYSHEIFEQVLSDASLHLITWQKGYEAQPWDPAAVSGAYALERKRNHSGDVRLYAFEYIDRPWAAQAGMRQILVRATNPSGAVVQVAILTDDLSRAAQAIIGLMFCRWIQENDFKYLDKHFGINQITSYQSIPYEDLAEGLTDRQVPSQAYVQEVKIGRELLKDKARLLLAADHAQRGEKQRQGRIAQLQAPVAAAAPPSPDAQRKELARLKSASQRFEKYHRQRALKIESVHEKILQHQARKEALQKEVSRVDQLVEQGMVRMDSANKTLMDAIKITARNLFYQALAPFKAAYNNYRDDHDYFRQLTQSAGVLNLTDRQVQVHLVPKVNFPAKLQKIISAILQNLTQKGLTLPDGSGRQISFHLTRREQIEVRLKNST